MHHTPIIDFAQHLLEEDELDPIYTALWEMKTRVNRHQVERWLFAYWCFYHAGLASFLSEHDDESYWKLFLEAAENKTESPVGGRWPRGKERRYFRGDICVKATRSYMQQTPEDIVKSFAFAAQEDSRYEKVAAKIQKLPLFGPWISFKVCDMLERVLGTHVDFTESAIFMFKDPTEAVWMLWRLNTGQDINDKTIMPQGQRDQSGIIHGVVEYLQHKLNRMGYVAPPAGDRQLNLQEIETVLCKWKSHVRGHYPFHNDKTEINDGLAPWTTVSPSAKLFSDLMPKIKNK